MKITYENHLRFLRRVFAAQVCSNVGMVVFDGISECSAAISHKPVAKVAVGRPQRPQRPGSNVKRVPLAA
jgi:hypothetical protein